MTVFQGRSNKKKAKKQSQPQTTLKNQVCAENKPGEERITGQKASAQR